MKNYEKWMPVKAGINNKACRPAAYHVGEVYWACIGENVGFEQDGKGKRFVRPMLVVQGFSRELVWGVPLTSQKKVGRFYHAFTLGGKMSVAILSQPRVIDVARISGERLGKVSPKTLLTIKRKLSELLR